MSKLKPLKCNLAALFCPFLLLSSFVWELHQIDSNVLRTVLDVLRTILRIYLPSVELMMFCRTDYRFWPALLCSAPASAFGSCVKTLHLAGNEAIRQKVRGERWWGSNSGKLHNISPYSIPYTPYLIPHTPYSISHIPYPSPIPPFSLPQVCPSFSLPQVYPSSSSQRLCFAQYA